MAKGIYTDPIPIRDINEDIRYLGEVLARNAEQTQKYNLAKTKALKDAKAKGDKLLFDQFEYDVSKIPKDFREDWLKFEVHQKQLFLQESLLGNPIEASNILTETANTFSEMAAYRAQYDEHVAESRKIVMDVALANEGLPIGYEYTTDFYNSDNIERLVNLHQEGEKYKLKWSPSEKWSYENEDGERISINRISELKGFNDPTALTGDKQQFTIISTNELASLKYADSKEEDMMGDTYGKIVTDEYKKAKNQADIPGAIAKGREIFDLRYDAQYADNNHGSGGQLRLTAIADARSLGINIPQEFLKPISQGITPNQYAEQQGGKEKIGNYEAIYDDVKAKHKEHLFTLISDQYNIKDIVARSSSGGKDVVGHFAKNVKINQATHAGEDYMVFTVPLEYKDVDAFSVEIEDGGTVTGMRSVELWVATDGTDKGEVRRIRALSSQEGADAAESWTDPFISDDGVSKALSMIEQNIYEEVTKKGSVYDVANAALNMSNFSDKDTYPGLKGFNLKQRYRYAGDLSNVDIPIITNENGEEGVDWENAHDDTTSTTGGNVPEDDTTPQLNTDDRRDDDGFGYVGQVNAETGEWEGQGTETWANGDKYVGEYKDGQRTGQGTYTWPSGGKYVGEWKDGNRHGQGIHTYANGRVEDGTWWKGLFKGEEEEEN